MVIKLTRACADSGQIWQLSTPNRHTLARFMGGWFGGWFTQIAHVVRTQWCDFYSTSKWFAEALFLGRNNNEHMFVKKVLLRTTLNGHKINACLCWWWSNLATFNPQSSCPRAIYGGLIWGLIYPNLARSTHTVVRFLLHFKVVRRSTFFGKK